MLPIHLAEIAPQLVGIATFGIIVAFISRKFILRILGMIAPSLLKLKLPIDIATALVVPGLLAYFSDGNAISTILTFNVGYVIGAYLLDL